MGVPPRFSLDEREAWKEYFEDHGFVILKDAVSKDAIANLRCEIAGIIRAFLKKAHLAPTEGGDAVFSEGILSLEAVDHEFVAATYDTIFQTPAFMRLISDQRIEGVCRELLGAPLDHPLYGFTNRCRIDPPQDDRRTYGWHQEIFYTIPRGRFVQTWAPLVFDTTIQSGTIEVADGSHRERIAPQAWNDIPGRATQIIVDDAVVKKYLQFPVEMVLGELLFFSGSLFHRSGRNSSRKVRYSLVGMYHDVMHEPFMTPKLSFSYRGMSPKEYYNEHITNVSVA
jgi:ectoine hydroxylase-related dioxygenase (phytanoyl-CoA dioxygenase family)